MFQSSEPVITRRGEMKEQDFTVQELTNPFSENSTQPPVLNLKENYSTKIKEDSLQICQKTKRHFQPLLQVPIYKEEQHYKVK